MSSWGLQLERPYRSEVNILKWPATTLAWLNKQNAVSGFFVTMLGVWAAFWVTGLSDRRVDNEATSQRLQLVHFEAEQNAILAQDIFRIEVSTNRADIILKRPQSSAVRSALADNNLPTFLPHAKLSMLFTYLDSIDALRTTLDIHSAHLVNVAFHRDADLTQCQKWINNTGMKAKVKVLGMTSSCHLWEKRSCGVAVDFGIFKA